MEPVHDSGRNNSLQDGVESIVGENHCEKEKWHDMLPDEEDMICRLHRLLGDSTYEEKYLQFKLKSIHSQEPNTKISPGWIASLIRQALSELNARHMPLEKKKHRAGWFSRRCVSFKFLSKRGGWELISGRIPNRTAEEVERYWRMKESKMLENKVFRPVCVRAKPSLKLAMMS